LVSDLVAGGGSVVVSASRQLQVCCCDRSSRVQPNNSRCSSLCMSDLFFWHFNHYWIPFAWFIYAIDWNEDSLIIA